MRTNLNYLKSGVLLMCVLSLAACGGGGGGGSSAPVVTHTVTASAGAGGSISPASATVDDGATTSFTVTPDASFFIDTVSGCGGSLAGSTYTTGTVTADCAVVASFGQPSLSFSTGPVATGALAVMPAIEVQIMDASGNLDTSATDIVTLSLGAVQPEILIHQSGNGPHVLEMVDLATRDQLGWFESQPGDEIGGMAYEANTGTLFYSVRRSNNFLSLDPFTDTQTLIGTGTTDNMKGIAFESSGANRLLAVPNSNSGLNRDSLYSIDPGTGVTTEIGTIVPDAGTILGFNGLATDPTTGTTYAVTKFTAGPTPRALTSINLSTLALTTIGLMNEAAGNNAVANIAFSADGTLYAITGDGSTDNPESLFTVNKATGELSLLASLDIIQPRPDGEAIGIIPAPLIGTVSVTAVSGVATFNDLKLNASATGYTLVASAAGFSDLTSGAFDITPVVGTAGQVQFTTADQTVGEDVGDVTLIVEIDSAQTHDVIVAMSVAGNSTGSGIDHDINTDNFFNITIPAGDLGASRSFAVIDDSLLTSAETVVFTIENASLANIGAPAVHTVNVTNNDPFLPVGPQVNVPATTVTDGGWSVCNTELYNSTTTVIADALVNCGKPRLMLACRPVGDANYALLAQAPRADVTFVTPADATTVHNANGTNWYFNDSQSWGFAPEGDVVNKDLCDFDIGVVANADQRLCWHTSGGNITDGYRCGTNVFIDVGWERLILHAD